MRIARLVVLDQGYMPVAVTSSDTKSGCWLLGGRFLAQLLVNGLVQGDLVMVSKSALLGFLFLGCVGAAFRLPPFASFSIVVEVGCCTVSEIETTYL
eukprot:scaffold247174_cov43-Cyclotella_meneghiniana.AAC.1